MERVLQMLEEEMALVEQQFRQDLDSEVTLIRKVGEYVLASGGKRMRPMLVLLCARLAAYQGESHIGVASVVEFIHTATLLHDDVVDSADLRRGAASANNVWGNEASVLVGDFLFSKSFSIMVRTGSLPILQALSDATTNMAEGEVLQLISTCDLDLSEERYMQVVRDKTAVLIAAACRCGGILGGVSAEQEQALQEFGMELGIAFQFMDDALDYVADQAEFGKACGHDLEEGKMTLPLIETLRHCSRDERDRVEQIVEKDQLSDEDLEKVIALIHQYDGIDYTRKRAKQLVESAKQRLAAFEDGEAKQALEILADYVVSRSK
ncbi:polyprenyl synthetase family protein [Desulfuromonas acetoxidans]|uniref:Octaprenyl diphosphate synthase n=1 Tax=Desulfuromonas acetoxidans (strain DSM 684 / 11070) TaxID=281689 RepID=Q1K0W2_DESA6|nr:polyprenyl synthetase family protein [Desulfuromonas acetoxidans]EAT16246.1 Trans-hexaprenyltranstransferase [Desulfuromonas acetoxidans DSM 684]MBF0645180.1 polyprenyl synthetase family protein [Desulfuromonas acetoxidans]NVD23076.1 polyprenyl synthetase family protein [Desulfuromonas acetoxidans]NVE15683.1 polyprenyl synthetase family protein [Desulfuromonas acetoxidans]